MFILIVIGFLWAPCRMQNCWGSLCSSSPEKRKRVTPIWRVVSRVLSWRKVSWTTGKEWRGVRGFKAGSRRRSNWQQVSPALLSRRCNLVKQLWRKEEEEHQPEKQLAESPLEGDDVAHHTTGRACKHANGNKTVSKRKHDARKTFKCKQY